MVLAFDGEKNPNTKRLFHSLGDSIGSKIQKIEIHWQLHKLKMGSVARRYAPMNKYYISGFPKIMSQLNWKKTIPILQDNNVDDALLHLIKFHIHSWKFKVEWHEDCLMKMFMATLERDNERVI